MCGIVGYIGDKEKKGVLLSGLKELEYRGYDSAGIGVLSGANNLAGATLRLDTFRAVGKLENLDAKCSTFTSEGFGVGIGHTRWATHGKPTELNAHPHIAKDCNVVHNGIIENYQSIKEDLLKKGFNFSSQTDTEIIAKLFEYNLSIKDIPLDAFKTTISMLKGAYAILLITKAAPECIFYAKSGSPLIIGIGKDKSHPASSKEAQEIYFSSSDAPLINLVESVVYLQDGDIGVMDTHNFDTLPNPKKLVASKSSAQKDGYRFFMEKEIYEQSQVLVETMMGRVSQGKIHLEELDKAKNLFDNISSITICACGTSYHAGLVGKYLLERIAKIKVNVVIASEYRYANPIMDKDELFLAISQSGETADTLEALKSAKKSNLKTLSICNVDNSSIIRESDISLLTRAGIEKGVASTKAFATQVMVLWILSAHIAQSKGEDISSHTKEMLSCIDATKVDSKLHERVKKLSKRYLHGHGFFFIGRDIFYPLALEGALKLKEISYLHAEGYASGEMKHGPIALADSELFCVALMPKNLLFDKIKSNVEELCARDATICAICSSEFDGADDMLYIEKLPSYMEEFFSMMVALQLLALEIAVRLGNDVDMPRNLAKSVTVE